MTTVPLFVYGTLRKGGALHHLIKHSIDTDLGAATMHGRLYYVNNDYEGYPVFDDSEEGVVVGDLYLVRFGPDVHYTISMEIGAGYEAKWLPAYCRYSGENMGEALAFTWKWPQRGRLIPTGDFFNPYSSDDQRMFIF